LRAGILFYKDGRWKLFSLTTPGKAGSSPGNGESAQRSAGWVKRICGCAGARGRSTWHAGNSF